MNSHDNNDFDNEFGDRLRAMFADDVAKEKQERRIADLRSKAVRMVADGSSSITAGKPGEAALREGGVGGVLLRQMPDDEHGVIRISVGGDDVIGYYCVVRGDVRDAERVLRRALRAIRRSGWTATEPK